MEWLWVKLPAWHLNSKGHIFLFQRVKPMLSEYDENGIYIRSIADGEFAHPHGLRIDRDDNLWTTDDGSHLVLKLSPAGRVLLVLGRKDVAAESDWSPTGTETRVW
jgi:streptogramin lyase